MKGPYYIEDHRIYFGLNDIRRICNVKDMLLVWYGLP